MVAWVEPPKTDTMPAPVARTCTSAVPPPERTERLSPAVELVQVTVEPLEVVLCPGPLDTTACTEVCPPCAARFNPAPEATADVSAVDPPLAYFAPPPLVSTVVVVVEPPMIPSRRRPLPKAVTDTDVVEPPGAE
jgi:hypothetical protein